MSGSMKGLREWTLQRISAVFMAVYIVLMFAYLASHPHLTYAVWHHLFTVFWVQVPTIIFLVCLMVHAWIGLWTIFTDYIKCACIRAILEWLVILALAVYFVWGVQIVWGIHFTWTF